MMKTTGKRTQMMSKTQRLPTLEIIKGRMITYLKSQKNRQKPRLLKAEMMDGRQIQKMIEALNKALIQTNKLYTIIRFLNLNIKKIYHF